MKKPTRKLAIRKETLVTLALPDLTHIVGGVVKDVQALSDRKECPAQDVQATSSGCV